MVFNLSTGELSEDDTVSTQLSRPGSPSSVRCVPLGRSFTRAITAPSRVAEGSSHGFIAPAVGVSSRRQEESSEDFHLGLLRPQVKLRKFTYRELNDATGNFSEVNVLGTCGSGKVYKGLLLDGSRVAIKRCARPFGHAEVQVGTMATHLNVIQMLGFCDSKETTELGEFLLVYQLAVNGNVASHLRERPASQPPLDWPTRMRIALGVAKGLSYLHEGCSLQIIHRDIKSSNILLDANLEPLIGDFGSAKLINHKGWNHQLKKSKSAMGPYQTAETEALNNYERPFSPLERSAELCSTFRLCGTYGYMPPEYVRQGELSAKNDVFAFGMVLLELISGFKPFDLLLDRAKKGINEFAWMKYLLEHEDFGSLVDPSLGGHSDENEVKKLVKLALWCIQSSPTERPTMWEVVGNLK
ncbi:hypothetical protein BT93_K1093 [Corymbia citriodora subsp. variegata]|nr:hypothetical protein BT93_K1093 [Corymbia citriodora subsp. variegata]